MSILDKIERCAFDCEAGPLSKCQDWIDLRAHLETLHVVLDSGTSHAPRPILHTSGGGWRTTVYTNASEAEHAARFLAIGREPAGRFTVARLVDVLPLDYTNAAEKDAPNAR